MKPDEVRRRKAWFTACAPVGSMRTSELLGLFVDLRTYGENILQISDTEWWTINRAKRCRAVADEIDRRLPAVGS
jgi:hypothetical protein